VTSDALKSTGKQSLVRRALELFKQSVKNAERDLNDSKVSTLAHAICYKAACGLSTTVIANRIGCSVPAVIKVLKQAEVKHGILKQLNKRSYFYVPQSIQELLEVKLASESIDEVALLQHELLERLRGLAKPGHRSSNLAKVLVFQTPPPIPPKNTPEFYDHAVYAFGQLAALDLKALICRSKSLRIGVSWGRPLHSVLLALTTMDVRKHWKGQKIKFFPLVGVAPDEPNEPDGLFNAKLLAAPVIAEHFDLLANGKIQASDWQPYYPPAFLSPDLFNDKDLKKAREVIFKYSSFQDIFHGKKPWVNQADTILCSFGSASIKSRFILDHFNNTKYSRKLLNKIFWGNLGSIYFPKENLSKSDKAKALKIQGRTLGINEKQLLAIADKTSKTSQVDPAGVIAIGVSPSRAESVIAGATRNLVNYLILDSSAAEAIVEILRKRQPEEFYQAPEELLDYKVHQRVEDSNALQHAYRLLMKSVSPPKPRKRRKAS
jgi:DNA-binding transcriptional regulator LsrR (DeoR family)